MTPSKYYDRMVVREGKFMSNWMTDTNHLRGFLNDIEPQKMDNLMNSVFMNRKDNDTPFLTDLESKATKTMLLTKETDSWSWKFQKPLTPPEVVEKLESGNTPGRGREPIKIKLDRDWFTYGDVIAADRFSQKLLRVMPNGIIPDGGGYIYVCQLVTTDPDDYFPKEQLEVGVQFEFVYSIYGEYNDMGTKVLHGGDMQLMNTLGGEQRVEWGLTDWADSLTITVSSVSFDDRGKPVTLKDPRWFRRDEIAGWAKHRRQKENYLVFGGAGNNLASGTRYDVTSGMGLWQMAHLGNVHYYSTLTMRKFEESLGEMYYGRVGMESRNTVLYTGEAGFLLFSQAVEAKMNGLGGLIPLDKFVTGSGLDMQFGYQFRRYLLPNGGLLTLKHLKSLDSWNTKTERGTGRYSRMSATFLGMDISNDGTENVQIVKRSTRPDDYWYYIPGTSNPFGPQKGGLAASKKAGYEMIITGRIGLHIEDVTKMFLLKPTFSF